MVSSVHLSQKGKVRSHRKKVEQEIIFVSAEYAYDFILKLTFRSGNLKLSTYKNFLPLFQQYVKGDNLKYFAPANFKKFIVKNGNIYWGKDEDVIFPSNILASEVGSPDSSEENLYII
ncbi:MAG: hypothetical protein SGI83_12125 [Bacteroidota bacterium]|nr:hypothetical protein [Bacteroidota bacterium]